MPETTMQAGRDGWQKESLGPVFSAMCAAARKKIGAPANWEAFSWEVIDHKRPSSDVLVRGSVPIGRTKKGQPKFGKVADADRVVVTKADVEAARQDFERETGKCSNCVDGQYCCGWSVDKGFKYRPCDRCGGTGCPLSVLPHDSTKEK